MTDNKLRQRIESGERDFEGEDLGDLCHDLRNMNLQDVNFSRTLLVADFKGSNLQGARFSSANVKTCDFSFANLSQARFDDAAIDGATFTAANLEDADFSGASEQGHVYAKGELPWSA